jgi:hypothetical protein
MNSVDVIVPCHRYGHFLHDCVHSVISQQGVDLRVLILDDASPDHTPVVGRQLAREDERVSYRRHPVNLGHIATYNAGIAWVRASYYLLLSADDLLLPGALARASALMAAHPEVGLCYGRALEQHDDGRLCVAGSHLAPRGSADRVMSGLSFIDQVRRCGTNNIVPTPTALVRSALQQRLEGYRPELPHSGDLELWLRLAAHASVGSLAANQAIYRRHSANMSRAYMGQHQLSDLRQRQAAVDCFCRSCSEVLSDPVLLRHQLLQALGVEAAASASSAFNNGQFELSAQLGELACTLHPGLTHTSQWLRLSLKRRLGPRVARLMCTTSGLLRTAASRLLA